MDEEGPRVIGWFVDMSPCEKHGGIGVGIRFFVQFKEDVIVPFWWCSIDPFPAYGLYSGEGV